MVVGTLLLEKSLLLLLVVLRLPRLKRSVLKLLLWLAVLIRLSCSCCSGSSSYVMVCCWLI